MIDLGNKGSSVQDRACIEYRDLDVDLFCMACVWTSSNERSTKGIRQACRFINFRRRGLDEDGGWTLTFDEKGIPQADRQQNEYYDWKPSRSTDHVETIKV
jgi:hypothetical protein